MKPGATRQAGAPKNNGQERDYGTTGLRTTGLRNYGTTELRDYGTMGLRDYGIAGPRDYEKGARCA
jgi:hypothetical protein